MDQRTFAISLLGAIAALLTPILTYLVGRRRANTEAVKTLTDGFEKLHAAVREDRQKLIDVIKAQIEENARLRGIIRMLDEAGKAGLR